MKNKLQVTIPTYILKIASRCNLECSYCYEYKFADQSWRKQPKIMSLETAGGVAMRISEHAKKHQLERVELCFHGGEPLLVGIEHMTALVKIFRNAVEGICELKMGLQTNGLLLTKEWIEFLNKESILVGVSLDGPPEVNDRNRVDFSQKGSHDQVAAALRLLRELGHEIYAGILCVIDVDSDAKVVFNHLAGFSPPNIDFLLPHGTWDMPPPGFSIDHNLRLWGWNAQNNANEITCRYGMWMAQVFDLYFSQTSSLIRIRVFEELIRVLLGAEANLESIGLAPARLLTISPSGEIQGVDTLKTVKENACDLGFHVATNTIDEAAVHPAVVARNTGLVSLCKTCQQCPYRYTCGGGYLPHRWSHENGFNNPSVYCADLRYLIDHIHQSLTHLNKVVSV